MTLPAGVSDSATYAAFDGVIVITKALVAASANNICLSQSVSSPGALLINGASSGNLDTQRRLLFTIGSEAAQRSLVITGLDSRGQAISETLTLPAGTPGTYPSARDYLVVLSIVSPAAFTGTVSAGTNTTGSTQWTIPSPLHGGVWGRLHGERTGRDGSERGMHAGRAVCGSADIHGGLWDIAATV